MSKKLEDKQYHLLQFASGGGWGDAASEWVAPSTFPDLTNSKILSVDLETRDPNIKQLGPGWCRKDGYIIGIAVSNGEYTGYFPIKHDAGGNLPRNTVMKWFAKQMATPNIPKVFHNALYDLGWLRAEGIEVQGRIIDTMVAAPLLNENRRYYNLNSLAGQYLGQWKNEKNMKAFADEMGVDPKSGMWRLPACAVGPYAEQDAAVTLKLWERLESEITTDECTSIFELETSLIPVLFDMKTRGVRVDIDKAELVKKDLAGREKKLIEEVREMTGVAVEPWVAASIAKAFDALSLPYPKTQNSGQPSFTKEFLSSHSHPVANKIAKVREFNKANTTFVDTILEHSHDGRIHCDFNQLRSDEGGTVTGRFSSSNPNLQQIPARDPEIKKMIRGLFIPEEGTKWGSFDYAAQEPRWLAHYCASVAGPHRHPEIDNVVQMYHEGGADFHQTVADMAGISRKEAKTVNLGIMYGMGRGKLATVLDVTDEEAKDLLAKYHQKVPFVKGIADMTSQHAEIHGVIRTWLGRKCRFNMFEPKAYGYNKALPIEEAIKEYGGKGAIRRAFTYKALNRLIQGSSADQTKKAMVDCYSEGLLPSLTVHDELCFNIENQEQADRIVEIMSTCVPHLKVPFEVDAELGDNWGEVG
jgi:DNA polymerase I-like protein with 3'-5' exonuclease and polymerase domains